MASDEINKIILKSEHLPGVDLSVLDLRLVSSVKVGITKVTKPIYKVGKLTYIGVKEKLDNGDVIQVGNRALLYKVRRHKKADDKYWNIYEIKRIDGSFTTSLDMEATKVGQKVRIVSRQSFEQIFNWACFQREENPVPTTTCGDDAEPCEDKEQSFTYDPPEADPNIEVPPTCDQYNITFPPTATIGKGMTFLNCDGEIETLNFPATKFEYQVIICTQDVTQNIYISISPISVVSTGNC